MYFGIMHGAKAHLFTPGASAEVVYKAQKLQATIIEHDGRHSVIVKLNEPILRVIITVTKRLFRSDLEEESVEWIEELSLWEDDVTPLNDVQ
ncbi:hypothetical protein KC865_01470 [Candidatus Kaiserbacteria bacterium]|nr:hypothetical protein [Candidatus Kaiserbacteria bacterium]USN92625.1 MAG: hypothetical protein H6782_02325 [Candidatus Nomurabacteria bacterium]